MRRGRVFFLLAFILIFFVGLAVVYFLVLRPRGVVTPGPDVETSPTPRPVEVVYVTQNIPKGTTLDETMLASIPWSGDAIAPGMFTVEQMDDVVGRVVKFDLEPGTPLLETLLLGENEQIPTSGSPWALSIPPGMVAVSVPMERISMVSYAAQPGDHVNIITSLMFLDVDTDFQSQLPNNTGLAIASGPPDPETGEQPPLTVGVASLGQSGSVDPDTGLPQPPPVLNPGIQGKVVIDPVLGQAVYVVGSEAQRPRYVTHMLLQDVVVLQVGEFPAAGALLAGAEPTPTPDPAAPPEEGEPAAAPARPDVVTLIVRPQDAVTLNYLMLAQSKFAASLSMVLRSANDTSRENVLPVTLQFLLEQYQIPVPARLPYSLNPRIDTLVLPGTPATPQP